MRYLQELEDRMIARTEGRDEGLEEGEQLTLLRLILTKLDKKKTPEEIASDLEMKPEETEKICCFLQAHPGLSLEELLKLWTTSK